MHEFYILPENKAHKDVYKSMQGTVKEIFKEGGVTVTLKHYKKDKTDQQRKYAHSCISIIAKHMGERPENLKIIIKESVGLIEEFTLRGKTLTVEKSTEKLNAKDYGIFIEAVLELGLLLDVKLPQPRDYGSTI